MHIDTYLQRGEMQDVEALIGRCRQLGVRHVCLSLGGWPGVKDDATPEPAYLKQYVRRLADAGIQAPVIIASFGKDPGLVLGPAGQQPALDAKRRTLDTLGEAGIGVLLNYLHLPMPADPADEARYWDGLLSTYRVFINHAEAANVRVANHAIWRCLPDPIREDALARGVTMQDYRDYRTPGWDGPYLLTSHQDIIRLLEGVPSSHNGVCFCTGMHIMGGDVPALVETFKGKIFYGQMRDIRHRWPAAEEVFLGTGDLDFTHILGLLDAAGFQGTIGAEHLGEPRYPGEDLTAAAVAFLTNRLAEVERQRG
jgi:sugar phosphate isomerase/epimerase